MAQCPICGDDATNVNNHVHACSGNGHGPRYEYPEGWNKEQHKQQGPAAAAQQAASDDAGAVADLSPSNQADDDSGESEPTEATGPDDAEPLELADRPDDARTYECGECGHRLNYLSSECGECGAEPVWGGVDPDLDADDGGETMEG